MPLLNDFTAARFQEYVRDDSPGGILFVGPRAREALRSFYMQASEEHFPSVWIEQPETEEGFWQAFLSTIPGKQRHIARLQKLLSRNGATVGADLAEAHLKREGRRYHVFVPDADELWYRLDVQGRGMLNNKLRRIWCSCPLNIYVSAEDERSRAYAATLGTQKFQFYAGNFLPIHADQG